MYQDILKQIRQSDENAMLNREFPGKSCGNKTCEELCSRVCKIAKMTGVNPAPLIDDAIRREIAPEYKCLPGGASGQNLCRFGFIKLPPGKFKMLLSSEQRKIIGKKYISDGNASKSGTCEQCSINANRVFKWPEEAHLMPKLPIHPNCKCHYENIYKTSKDKHIKNIADLKKLVKALQFIWKNKIPKPPRITTHEGIWSELLWMWFYEQGPNPIRFGKDSPYSRDIANSYSMQVIKKQYKRTGIFPTEWQFLGPDTAKYVFGEVEWFLGSYSIRDVAIHDKTITFTVYNRSSWRSGTRLPASWTQHIKAATGYEIKELVTSANRGEVLKTKIRTLLPDYLQTPVTEAILNMLPSLGGNWDQYYEIEVKWGE